MLKKHFFLGLLAAVLVVAACSGNESDGSGETTVVRFQAQSSLQAGYDAVIEQFEEANPGIEIESSYSPNETYPSVLRTQLQGGSGPDVFFTYPSSSDPHGVRLLADAGYLEDLTGREWEPRIMESAKPQVTFDGRVYGWVPGAIVAGLGYNTELLSSELGLQIPRTFDDLLSMCETIASEGKIPIAYQAGALAYNMLPINGTALSTVFYGEPRWQEQRLAGEVSFASTPGWRVAVQRVLDMQNAGCFQQGAAGASSEEAFSLVADGEAVMTWLPTSAWSVIEGLNPDIKLGQMPVPGTTEEDTVAYFAPNTAISVNADSNVKEAALEFLDYTASEEVADQLAEDILVLSAEQLSGKGLPPTIASGYANVFEDPDKVILGLQWGWNPDLTQTMETLIQGLISGQKTVDDVLTEMDQAWDANPPEPPPQ